MVGGASAYLFGMGTMDEVWKGDMSAEKSGFSVELKILAGD